MRADNSAIARVGKRIPVRLWASLPTALLVGAIALLAACSANPPLQVPLTKVGEVPLPQEQGKALVDLLSVDTRAGRLYVPHTSANSLDVIDLRDSKVLGSVRDLPRIKGVTLTADPALVFTSNGGDGTVTAVDVEQLRALNKIRVGGRPDAIDYDPLHDLVIVSLAASKKVALIERKTSKVAALIDLPGDPELMAVDAKGGKVYLAIHDKDSVVAIDVGRREVVSTYRGCDIKAPTGVAYDSEQGRLFVASKGQLNIIDVLLDRCLGVVDIGSGTDQIAINPHTHHLYTANAGSKNLSVVDIVTLKPLGIVGTGPGAATLAVDPTTDKVYVALGPSGLIAIYHDP